MIEIGKDLESKDLRRHGELERCECSVDHLLELSYLLGIFLANCVGETL